MNPIISFVIIEYFSIQEIKNCIHSIIKNSSSLNYEIIISSNSLYPLTTQHQLQNEFKGIIWSFNDRNGGFAYGMNQGLKRASGKYLIICNPDVRLIKGLDNAIEFMNSNQIIGAIGPKIIDQDRNIQDSCREYVSIPKFLQRQIFRFFSSKECIVNLITDYSKIQTVDWVIGAFIIIRKNAYEETKGLDENYFLYAEDLDWCTRIRKKGYEIVYYPKMLIEYKGSRAARKSLKYAIIFIKSHFIYWRKNGFFSIKPKRKELTF